MTNSPNNMTLLYCPFPSQQEAEKVASQLLTEKLIACANILSSGKSLYLWEGEIKVDAEVYALFKAPESLAEAASKRITELHPYEIPAVIRMEAKANAAFAQWLSEVTKGPTP